MAKALESFHHALGTVQADDDLPDDPPIVVACPPLFVIAPRVKPEPSKPAKSKG